MAAAACTSVTSTTTEQRTEPVPVTTTATAPPTTAAPPSTAAPPTSRAATTTTSAVAGCAPGVAAPPPDATGATRAAGDFDGDGHDDELYVYAEAASGSWRLLVVFADGHSDDVLIPGSELVAQAVGGWDLDDDGADEVFAVVGSGAAAAIIGIYAVSGCNIIPVAVEATTAPAQFPVGASVANQSGLECPAAGGLVVISQSTADGFEYVQVRDRYALTEGSTLTFLGSDETTLRSPDDDPAIFAAAGLSCGDLRLF